MYSTYNLNDQCSITLYTAENEELEGFMCAWYIVTPETTLNLFFPSPAFARDLSERLRWHSTADSKDARMMSYSQVSFISGYPGTSAVSILLIFENNICTNMDWDIEGSTEGVRTEGPKILRRSPTYSSRMKISGPVDIQGFLEGLLEYADALDKLLDTEGFTTYR